ncbi:hypothetical protein [Shewanella algae]|uniref:hypothetical protein n=1 Tax=Shewanella algae TaxID=38313 RepID=UPI001AAE14CE|nr:hypothetical protein [Shewanella algae]MBO2600784.1 hypothetical protein [Shewanella algae]MBO2600795.1 hypothetical protein [Shewanella algae]
MTGFKFSQNGSFFFAVNEQQDFTVQKGSPVVVVGCGDNSGSQIESPAPIETLEQFQQFVEGCI